MISLAFVALVSAQAPPAGGAAAGEPCPPQFTLQCCQHVISAVDAGKFNIQVDAKANPGLAGTSCKLHSRGITSLCSIPVFIANILLLGAALNAQGGQCAQENYPVCCKQVTGAFSAGCIPA
jgi:hypothetical protein